MNIFGLRLNRQTQTANHMARELRNRGLRMTPQRLMIVAAVENSNDHISAEEIHAQVVEKYPDINVSTVYRTLDTLEEMGMVTRTDLGGGRVRYHPAAKGHHHHLICRQCGAITDLDETVFAELKENLMRDYSFTADLRHLAIWGTCARCSRQVVQEG
jgi:Fur family ferric uptake transcriptional regulator